MTAPTTTRTFRWGKHPDASDYIHSGHLPNNCRDMVKLVEKATMRKDLCTNKLPYTVQFFILPKLLSKPVSGTICQSMDKLGRPYPLIEGKETQIETSAAEWEQYYQQQQNNPLTFNDATPLSRKTSHDSDRIVFSLPEDCPHTAYSTLKICRLNIKRKPHTFFVFNQTLELFYRKPTYLDMARIMKTVVEQPNNGAIDEYQKYR